MNDAFIPYEQYVARLVKRSERRSKERTRFPQDLVEYRRSKKQPTTRKDTH